MSEKEARELIEVTIGIHKQACPCHICELGKPILSQPPDFVVLLRRLKDWYVAGGGLAHVALGMVIDEVEKTVRLTDEPPGWEYTNDQP